MTFLPRGINTHLLVLASKKQIIQTGVEVAPLAECKIDFKEVRLGSKVGSFWVKTSGCCCFLF